MVSVTQKWTPTKLVKKLKESVIGQDRYLEDLCTSVWLHSLRKDMFLQSGEAQTYPKLNLLVLGKSGCGKTSAVKALASILNLNVVIEDAGTFTGAGWKGREVNSIVTDILSSAKNIDHATFSIVVLDEIDKIFHSHLRDPSFSPENNLLKFIEGTTLRSNDEKSPVSFDTSNILFICLGAFDGLEDIIKKRLGMEKHIGFSKDIGQSAIEGGIYTQALPEDLIKCGVNPQFLGRMNIITAANELTAADFEEILLNSKLSAVKQFDALLFDSLGVHVSISKEAAHHIAQKAAGSGMGARTLAQELSRAYVGGFCKIADKPGTQEIRLVYEPETQSLSLRFFTGSVQQIPKSRHSPALENYLQHCRESLHSNLPDTGSTLPCP